jgi:hypothetical protein
VLTETRSDPPPRNYVPYKPGMDKLMPSSKIQDVFGEVSSPSPVAHCRKMAFRSLRKECEYRAFSDKRGTLQPPTASSSNTWKIPPKKESSDRPVTRD